MNKLLLTSLLLLSFNSYSACLDSAYSTMEMRKCYVDEFKAEEQKLSDTLQQAYKTSPSITKEIKQSQLTWLGYRKSHCNASLILTLYCLGSTPSVSIPKIRLKESMALLPSLSLEMARNSLVGRWRYRSKAWRIAWRRLASYSRGRYPLRRTRSTS